MTQRIPVANTDSQTFATTLNGQPVELTIWWQPGVGDRSWYFSLAYPPGSYGIEGRRITPNVDLTAGLLPDFAGRLLCVQLSNREYPAGPTDAPWGRTHDLIYEPP